MTDYRCVALATALICASIAMAQSDLTIDREPLPKYLAPDEVGLPLDPVVTDRAAPIGQIHCAAEYEPMAGLLIAWRGYPEVLTPMVVGITNNDPTGKVWVVVNSAQEQNSATTTLQNAGADMSQVVFIVRSLNSVWIRDYGPRYVFVDGVRSIIDHTYNRPRPLDNQLNDYLATLWSEPQYDIPLVHGGGNFHLFADGDAFMTRLIVNENPGWTEPNIIATYAAYQNVNLTLFDGFPTSFDSTQHIDMWMLPVADKKVIVGQYASSTGQPYTITENAVSTLQGRGYTVYRTPGWRTGAHYTYTNAVIFNNLVFMSKFNNANDAAALGTFQTAFPGKLVFQVDCSGIITAAGAIHCIVMHVPAYPPAEEPVVSLTAPNGGEFVTIGTPLNITWTAIDNVAITAVDIRLSRDGGATYPEALATGIANSGAFAWNATGPASTNCRVKVIAYDGDGNSGEDASSANFTLSAVGPMPIFSYPMNDNSAGFTLTGQWQIGDPLGAGGAAHGNPDPQNGFTGSNCAGVNLSGDYATTIGGPFYMTTPVLDLTGVTQTKLRYRRWLNSDIQPYVVATVEVSNNGSTWSTLWSNGTTEVADSSWTAQEHNIAAIADNQATVRVRWSHRVAQSGAWAYSGWNVDDIQIIGVPSLTPGDLNCDGAVDFADIDPFVLALSGEANYAALYPDCEYLHADCNSDGLVDFSDIDAFVGLIGG